LILVLLAYQPCAAERAVGSAFNVAGLAALSASFHPHATLSAAPSPTTRAPRRLASLATASCAACPCPRCGGGWGWRAAARALCVCWPCWRGRVRPCINWKAGRLGEKCAPEVASGGRQAAAVRLAAGRERMRQLDTAGVQGMRVCVFACPSC
jgi:hypothetical protein